MVAAHTYGFPTGGQTSEHLGIKPEPLHPYRHIPDNPQPTHTSHTLRRLTHKPNTRRARPRRHRTTSDNS